MNFLDETKIPDHPYPELRDVLRAFVDEITTELAQNLVGVYLVGSLASGDFDLDSDVDFLVVTQADLTAANQKSLQDVHQKVHDSGSYPARHLEGSYITISDLNDWGSVGEKKLTYFDNGSTQSEQSTHDNNWHVRWILRERGITLVGPEPATILLPIPRSELTNEMKKSLWQVMDFFQADINRPLRFWNSRFGQSFTVLTCCRMLHTLHTGTVQSKKAGLEWAKEFVDPRWVQLIEQAWLEREGVRFGVKISQRAESKRLNDTLEFIQYALEWKPGLQENEEKGTQNYAE